jgi:hypothetical protein
MGLKRIVIDKDFDAFLRHGRIYLRLCIKMAVRYWQIGWHGWADEDIQTLERTLNDSTAYDGGIIKLTQRQYCALKERNRRIVERKRDVKTSPLLAWVDGRGLFRDVRKD